MSSGVAPRTRLVVTIAPALTIGLNGRFDCSSTVIELNGSPVGSTPTRIDTASTPWSSSASPYANGLEIDWIVNSWSTSPTSYA